jgi:hypothetical protein
VAGDQKSSRRLFMSFAAEGEKNPEKIKLALSALFRALEAP